MSDQEVHVKWLADYKWPSTRAIFIWHVCWALPALIWQSWWWVFGAVVVLDLLLGWIRQKVRKELRENPDYARALLEQVIKNVQNDQ